jgi:hypothetical protein
MAPMVWRAHLALASTAPAGLLSRVRPSGAPPVIFRPDPTSWFATLLAKPMIKLLARWARI